MSVTSITQDETPPADDSAVRRTQRDRRMATISKLVDAVTDALVEVGYARTSVAEICNRAGVSHGGLFRHFSSRMQLMIATASHVQSLLLDRYRTAFDAHRNVSDPVELAVRLAQSNARTREQAAWFEFLVAARTDKTLREALRPLLRAHAEANRSLGASLVPDLASRVDDFPALVDTVVFMFHGEAISSAVVDDADASERHVQVLMDYLRYKLGARQ